MAHGKSTVVKAISGVNTVRTKPELERNITIKLGYANAKVFKCEGAEEGVPGNYRCAALACPLVSRTACLPACLPAFVDWT